MNEKIEALKTASKYIINLKNGINTATDNFKNDKHEQGIELIPLIADGINWVVQVLELTKDIHKEQISIEELNSKLKELLEAIEVGDYLMVGNILQYEIFPSIEEMERIIDEFLLN